MKISWFHECWEISNFSNKNQGISTLEGFDNLGAANKKLGNVIFDYDFESGFDFWALIFAFI